MSGNVRWDEFMLKLGEHLGTTKRAQTIFCEQTEYSLSSLQYWRKRNQVPEKAVALIATIDREGCDFQTFKGYHKVKFADRVVALSKTPMTLKQMADKLSQEFGRKITENAIKGARYRHKAKIDSYKNRDAR